MVKSLSLIFLKEGTEGVDKKSFICSSEKIVDAYELIQKLMTPVINIMRSDHMMETEIYGINYPTARGGTFIIGKERNIPQYIEIVSGDQGEETLREICKHTLHLPFDYKKINEKI